MQSDINLLKSAYDQSDSLSPIQAELRRFSIWSLIIVVGVGIITLGIYLVLSTTHQSLTDTHAKLTAQLGDDKTKESLMAVIKSRIGTVSKALDSTKPVDKLLTNIYMFCRPPNLTGITQDDKGRYNFQYKADSISDVMGVTTGLIDRYNQKQISGVMLDGFSMDKNGISLTFSFMPNWANL